MLFGLPEDAPHLEEALTHPSFANEAKDARHNQRLEFFGDAVLSLCVSELLMERFPEAREGELTRMRAQVINGEWLASWAREVGVAGSLRVGRGASSAGLSANGGALADAVEALLGATYLDAGLDAARDACRRIIAPALDAFERGTEADAKSQLQELVQSDGGDAPTYSIVDRGGPPHDPWFEAEVVVRGRGVARGRGRSKRLAERAAAEAALAARSWCLPLEGRP